MTVPVDNTTVSLRLESAYQVENFGGYRVLPQALHQFCELV